MWYCDYIKYIKIYIIVINYTYYSNNTVYIHYKITKVQVLQTH